MAGSVTGEMRPEGDFRIELRSDGRHNCMTVEMWEALGDLVEEATRTSCRAIVVRGHGDSFCSGGDMREYGRIGAEPEFGKRAVSAYLRAITGLRFIDRPTLALLDGAIVGAGAGLAAACDFRIATPSTFLKITALQLGLVFPIEELNRIGSLIGLSELRRVLYLGAVLDASRLAALGFAESLVQRSDLDDAGQSLLVRLIHATPEIFSLTKRQLAQIERGGVDETPDASGAAVDAFQHRYWRETGTPA